MTIRRGEPRDAATVADFNRRMARETEHRELDAGTVGRGVARVLADPSRGFYLVAEEAGEILAQLMVTFEWSDWRDGWMWWIQSVYVRENARRRGLFRTLFLETERLGREAGDVVGLRLYVERENSRAQETYRHLGMSDPGYLMFEKAM